MYPPLILNLHLPTKFIPSNSNPDGFSPFPMLNLTPFRLTRFNLKYCHPQKIILHHRKLLQVKPVLFPPMADREGAVSGKTDSQSPPPPEKNPAKELPPPPEKPEPGDCCGSGCVRCVWDVYYEELEAYNQAVKQLDSQSKSPS